MIFRENHERSRRNAHRGAMIQMLADFSLETIMTEWKDIFKVFKGKIMLGQYFISSDSIFQE